MDSTIPQKGLEKETQSSIAQYSWTFFLHFSPGWAQYGGLN